MGAPLPAFRCAVGFPSCGAAGKAAAECWNKTASASGHYEIFIRPDEDDAMMVAGHLAHELTHAAVGFECGHKGEFARVVLALGLNRPLTSTTPGPVFKEYAAPLLEKLGPLPHARLKIRGSAGAQEGGGASEEDEGKGNSNSKPKQKTRLLKCICSECGYTVRTTQKWLEVGPPHCPLHGAMDTDASDYEEGGA